MLPSAVSSLQRSQTERIATAVAAAQREWLSIGDDFDTGWARVGPRLTLLVGSARLGAARDGADSVPAALDELGVDVAAEGAANARAFGAFASDGRPLDSLLFGSVVNARTADVATLPERLAVGSDWLRMTVATQVSDAARAAAQVNIVARPRTGYVRETGPKCCSRCAVMAGKFFRYNTGFLRHPSCQCVHVPCTLESSRSIRTTEPRITDLTKSQRKALDDGADLSQVVNAKRGASGMTTTEGTTRRGLAYGRLQGRARLTPDGIYRIASDRTEAIALLKAHGYLI